MSANQSSAKRWQHELCVHLCTVWVARYWCERVTARDELPTCRRARRLLYCSPRADSLQTRPDIMTLLPAAQPRVPTVILLAKQPSYLAAVCTDTSLGHTWLVTHVLAACPLLLVISHRCHGSSGSKKCQLQPLKDAGTWAANGSASLLSAATYVCVDEIGCASVPRACGVRLGLW